MEGKTERRLIGGWCGGRSDGEGGGERARCTRAARVARGIVARGERAESAFHEARERRGERRARERERERERNAAALGAFLDGRGG